MPACRTSQMSICPSGSETPLLPVPDVTEVGDPEGQPGLAEPEPQPGTSTEVPFGQASADQPRGTTTARGVGAPTSREFYDLGVRMLQDYSRHQPHAGTNERIAALANQVMMCQQQIIHLQEQGRLSEQLGRIGNIMEQSIQQQHQTLLAVLLFLWSLWEYLTLGSTLDYMLNQSQHERISPRVKAEWCPR
ncbi:uncharacterized protein PAF06_004606 [Gastrophryne carolinensis]